jgi:hypothetical protein
MHFVRVISALALLGSVAGCAFPRTQTQYNPAAVEQPQPVNFFYGKLVAVNVASLEYPYEPGIGVRPGLSPYLAGLHLAGSGSAGGLRVTGGFVDVLFEGSVPNLPAIEYTVMLNTGTYPPDTFVADPRRAAVIVVQNEYPDRYPSDVGMAAGEDVVVRVVGHSGRVMRDPFAPPRIAERDGDTTAGTARRILQQTAESDGNAAAGTARRDLWQAQMVADWRADARTHLAAVAPMPIPVGGQPISYPPASAQGYGYQQYYRHWTIEP